MPTKPTGDPALKTAAWKRIRAYWLTGPGKDTPCARCGGPIDRTPGARGPMSLDVGHIVDRVVARQAGWTEAQVNTLSNTAPEHQRCGRKAGAKLGAARRWGNKPQTRRSRAW